MIKTKIKIDTNFQIDNVDPRIFGGFIEHMGRCIYEGIYDTESDLADEDGFRTDVLESLNTNKYAFSQACLSKLYIIVFGL